MRKKIIAILFTIITIIYIVVGAFLFLNIQLIETPEIIIKIEVSEINSEEAILHTNVNINNPNSFEIIVKNLKVVTTTPDGYEVAHIAIEGGEIGSHKTRTFTNDVFIVFSSYNPELLTSKITGEVGANIWLIQKTIPLNIGVITSIGNLTNQLAAPSVSITVDFTEMTNEGINITAIMKVYNPNPFDIFIDDISADILTEEDKKIGNINVSGGIIEAKDYLSLDCVGRLLFEAFNAKSLVIDINGVAGAKIAGYEKNLSFNIQTNIMVPDLEQLLLSKNNPTILIIEVDEKLTFKGIVFNILLNVNNTYKVDLLLKDIGYKIYKVVNDAEYIIGENNQVEDIFAESGKTGGSSCSILVPFSNLLPISLSIDGFMVTVSARVTIKGVNQSVYLELRGYLDIHLFR